MTEQEKMLAGKIYDPTDPLLAAQQHQAHRLSKRYNDTFDEDTEERAKIVAELLPNADKGFTFKGQFSSITAFIQRLATTSMVTPTLQSLTTVRSRLAATSCLVQTLPWPPRCIHSATKIAISNSAQTDLNTMMSTPNRSQSKAIVGLPATSLSLVASQLALAA